MINQTKLLQQLENSLKSIIINNLSTENNIHSIIDNEIPYYFSNKIEEINAVIGQQQLEAYDQIINIFKNKNKDDKIETLKRNHIQKCIQWCEKYKIPYNTITGKINIFLKNRDIKETDEAVIIENVVLVASDDDIVAVNGTGDAYFIDDVTRVRQEYI